MLAQPLEEVKNTFNSKTVMLLLNSNNSNNSNNTMNNNNIIMLFMTLIFDRRMEIKGLFIAIFLWSGGEGGRCTAA